MLWGEIGPTPRSAIQGLSTAKELIRMNVSETALHQPSSATVARRKDRSAFAALSGVACCVQCRVPQPLGTIAGHAVVACQPVIQRWCVHGPFCAHCRRAINNCVLPTCVCRALIASWRETPWPAMEVEGPQNLGIARAVPTAPAADHPSGAAVQNAAPESSLRLGQCLASVALELPSTQRPIATLNSTSAASVLSAPLESPQAPEPVAERIPTKEELDLAAAARAAAKIGALADERVLSESRIQLPVPLGAAPDADVGSLPQFKKRKVGAIAQRPSMRNRDVSSVQQDVGQNGHDAELTQDGVSRQPCTEKQKQTPLLRARRITAGDSDSDDAV